MLNCSTYTYSVCTHQPRDNFLLPVLEHQRTVIPAHEAIWSFGALNFDVVIGRLGKKLESKTVSIKSYKSDFEYKPSSDILCDIQQQVAALVYRNPRFCEWNVRKSVRIAKPTSRIVSNLQITFSWLNFQRNFHSKHTSFTLKLQGTNECGSWCQKDASLIYNHSLLRYCSFNTSDNRKKGEIGGNGNVKYLKVNREAFHQWISQTTSGWIVFVMAYEVILWLGQFLLLLPASVFLTRPPISWDSLKRVKEFRGFDKELLHSITRILSTDGSLINFRTCRLELLLCLWIYFADVLVIESCSTRSLCQQSSLCLCNGLFSFWKHFTLNFLMQSWREWEMQ